MNTVGFGDIVATNTFERIFSIFFVFIACGVFVVITMNTVGFGDIVATNTFERIFSIFFVFIACGVFAYTINSI